MSDDWEAGQFMKVSYAGGVGFHGFPRTSSAYVTTLHEPFAVGTNKHTDEPVAVRWSDGLETWVECAIWEVTPPPELSTEDPEQTQGESMTPTIGRIVHYTLSAANADAINRRRNDATRSMAEHRENANGTQIHIGNPVTTGDVYPMLIARVSGDRVGGQVFLDGNDVLWVTSVIEGTGPGTYAWPARS